MKNYTIDNIIWKSLDIPRGEKELKPIKIGKSRIRGFVLVEDGKLAEFRQILSNTGWHIIGE